MVSTHSQNAKSLMLAYINVETYVMCVKNFSVIFFLVLRTEADGGISGSENFYALPKNNVFERKISRKRFTDIL